MYQNRFNSEHPQYRQWMDRHGDGFHSRCDNYSMGWRLLKGAAFVPIIWYGTKMARGAQRLILFFMLGSYIFLPKIFSFVRGQWGYE